MRNVLLYLLTEVMLLVPALGGLGYARDFAAGRLPEMSGAAKLTQLTPYGGAAQEKNAPVTLRVGTYNIKNGHEVGYDYAVLASDILAVGLDVCGLQEVDRNTFRNGGKDTMKLLSEATGYPYYAFTKAIDYSGGECGTGILSKYPIISYETVLLESGGYEQRAYGHAVLAVNGKLVDFYNTHLCYQNSWRRGVQFAALAKALAGKTRWVLTGDFNARDYSEYACIADSQTVNNEKNRMRTGYYRSTTDNIVLPAAAKVLASGVYDQVTHSDHHLLWADVTLP